VRGRYRAAGTARLNVGACFDSVAVGRIVRMLDYEAAHSPAERQADVNVCAKVNSRMPARRSKVVRLPVEERGSRGGQ
jgi:hypothetical protein